MSTKTRSRLSIENKREICEYARRHPNVKHSDMANYFNEKFNLTIDRSTVSKILLKKEKWLTNKQTSNMFMNLLNLKEFQSKRQQSIDAYFSAS